MRLLECSKNGDISLTKDLVDGLPPYCILSHTWGEVDDEVSFEDLERGQGESKSGHAKIQFCARQALQDGLQHFWVDTCCIDRANLVELSEAITSMFRWYNQAAKCYVYLSDVSADGDDRGQEPYQWEAAFRRSRWLKRGWTLQELLAPASVEFYSREGRRLGDKKTLEQLIHEITQIPVEALRGQPLSHFPVDERLRWTDGRQTKKVEDRAYCLLGIFDVSMSLRYGEGEKAITRLKAKVQGSSKASDSQSDSQMSGVESSTGKVRTDLVKWLSPVHPDEIHVKVSASRHPDTGLDFTSGPLLSWLEDDPGHGSMLWITGKSGTGKTTLFSHIVEKTREFVSTNHNSAFAYHYCAFSDPESQQPINILGSFAVQISTWRPSILEDLNKFFERDRSGNREKTLQVGEVEQVLVEYIASFNTVILLLDALNESHDLSDTVAFLTRLLQQAPNLKIIATSTRSASTAGPKRSPYVLEHHLNPNADIRAFVEAHLSARGSLQYLSPECRQTVRSTLAEKADQTFRWVALTLDNLCRQRTGKGVLKALAQMPEGLNNTYASMLRAIPAMDRPIAREALLWLSFALRPMTLLELSEAAILEDDDTTLNQDSRLQHPQVILEICHGFIEHDPSTDEVKLAHSSVKDYLLSQHARSDDGDAFFAFAADQGHQALMHKCLTYLMFDDFTPGVALSRAAASQRMRAFPLLEYAAYNWGLHARSATSAEWTLAHQLFATRSLPRGGNYGAWVNCLIPECHPSSAIKTQPLYYAASFGILPLVRTLLTSPTTSIDALGGRYHSTALQVAMFRGRRAVSELLLAAGADFWSPDRGSGAPAWFWAQCNGWTDLLAGMVRLRPQIMEDPAWVTKGVEETARADDGIVAVWEEERRAWMRLKQKAHEAGLN